MLVSIQILGPIIEMVNEGIRRRAFGQSALKLNDTTLALLE
jgi:hypothetical protein